MHFDYQKPNDKCLLSEYSQFLIIFHTVGGDNDRFQRRRRVGMTDGSCL